MRLNVDESTWKERDFKRCLQALAQPRAGERYYDVDFGSIVVVREVTDGRVYYVNADEPLATNNVDMELWMRERARLGVTYEGKSW